MKQRIIEDISNFIFVEDAISDADVIFIPGGSHPEPPEKAAMLWKSGYAPIIVPSGRFSITNDRFLGVESKKEIYFKDYTEECDFYTDVLLLNGVDESCIIKENKASYTYQNALFSKNVLDENRIYPKKAILCCKNFHARRCLMYYQLVFQSTELMVAPVPYSKNGVIINKDNWYLTNDGINCVLGELSRLGNQFGDIFKGLI